MASAAPGTAFRHLRDLFTAGSVVGLEDGPLLARYSRSNDPAAFEALVGRHGPTVLAACRAVLRNEQDVEDAFQATFLVLARKADSVRGGQALGAWLHRVAYRASVQASIEAKRRRRTEAEAALVRSGPSRSESELLAGLHEEIDRLPEPLRLSVVLCDLEGLTYEEAARQLGWTVPTLRHRLVKARRKLKGRLTGRAGLSAVVPPALARTTLAAALGGSTSAGSTLLTHALLKGMLMTKLKTAAAALAGLALASAGLIAAGGVLPAEDAGPARERGAGPLAVAPEIAAVADEVVEVKGRVVGPDGQPVAGATVTPVHYDLLVRPYPEATSGPDGRFSILIPRSSRQAGQVEVDRFPWLVASAPGFGPGWTMGVFKDGGAGERTIRLVEDGSPIEGRLVDLEGRPLVGVRVATRWIYFATKGRGDSVAESGDLAAWLEHARKDANRRPCDGLAVLRVEPLAHLTATTGLDGRFRLAGIGRDRVASLIVSGPSIVTSEILAMTRDAPEVRAVDETLARTSTLVFHSPRFDDAIGPCKPLRGVARDKDTGQPLAGLVIRAGVYDRRGHVPPGVEAVTDAEGRYTLTGLVGAPAYRLSVAPGPGLPYPKAGFKAQATSPATEPVDFDFALKRGVVIRGRVTDKATGLPAPGNVNAFTFADSPAIAEYPGYVDGDRSYGYLDRDGRYELVVPPGRTLVACRSDMDRYRVGLGAEGIAGYEPRFNQQFTHFRTVPSFQGVANYHALAALDLEPGARSATLDLQVDPGRSLEMTALDPEGRPIGGTKAAGTREQFAHTPAFQASPTFEIRSLMPGSPRRVTVSHEGRKLIGSAYLQGDEAGPLTIRLAPWGTIEGRIVDADGGTNKHRCLSAGNNTGPVRLEEIGTLPGSTNGGGVPADKGGGFRVEGLVPGLKYASNATDGEITLGELFKDVVVAPGEVKDLGDLKVRPSKP